MTLPWASRSLHCTGSWVRDVSPAPTWYSVLHSTEAGSDYQSPPLCFWVPQLPKRSLGALCSSSARSLSSVAVPSVAFQSSSCVALETLFGFAPFALAWSFRSPIYPSSTWSKASLVPASPLWCWMPFCLHCMHFGSDLAAQVAPLDFCFPLANFRFVFGVCPPQSWVLIFLVCPSPLHLCHVWAAALSALVRLFSLTILGFSVLRWLAVSAAAHWPLSSCFALFVWALVRILHFLSLWSRAMLGVDLFLARVVLFGD